LLVYWWYRKRHSNSSAWLSHVFQWAPRQCFAPRAKFTSHIPRGVPRPTDCIYVSVSPLTELRLKTYLLMSHWMNRRLRSVFWKWDLSLLHSSAVIGC